jgi:para-aminobenzoate synthetase component I
LRKSGKDNEFKKETFLFLNGNKSNSGYIAIGCKKEIVYTSKNIHLEKLNDFISIPDSWKFGYISYDVKNEFENLPSANLDGLEFPEIHFFIPQTLFKIEKDNISLIYGDISLLVNVKEVFLENKVKKTNPITLTPRINKEEYLAKVKSVKENIQQGDVYEMNFCYELFNENVEMDPFETYKKLNKLTNAPFSCFGSFNNKYILSASPERYISKTGQQIISQPIKGTISRGANEVEDLKQIESLKKNQKERSENIMIVDLVRNDLSKIATKNSVKVEELCGIYTFETVHQMISTISTTIKPQITFLDILKATFPMGSMTGAPKIRAMELIEKYESTKRGVYSGCVGYVKPNGDFDFNVIIRTLLYNSKKKYLSCMVGGAITSKSNEKEEYQETLLKAKALLQALK